MTIVYIFLSILLLGILITVHELGHFLAARMTGIEVAEFGIGFGPKLFSRKSKKHETVFSLRAFPLGGFCAFIGEDDPTGLSGEDPRAFRHQNVWKRLFTILMGPMMNFLLAFVVGIGFYFCEGVTVATGIDPYVASVSASGPAWKAGLQDGDIITEINGVSVMDGTMETLTDAISAWKEGDPALRMTVQRGEETLSLEMTPFWDEEAGKMRVGITVGGVYRTEQQPVHFAEAVNASASLCVQASGAILSALGGMVTTGEGLDQTAGPVGVVTMVTQQVEAYGFSMYVQLLVLISINLGLMNLLPFPGLDGSRLIFGLIEVIRRKPVPPEKEAVVHLVGMALLFGLMIFFTFRDIANLFK